MIQKLGIKLPQNIQLQSREVKENSNANPKAISNPIGFKGSEAKISNLRLLSAYQGMSGIPVARTVSFRGTEKEKTEDIKTFDDAYRLFTKEVKTCRDAKGEGGDKVGSRFEISDVVSPFARFIPADTDAYKHTLEINKEKNKETDKTMLTDARTQMKRDALGHILYEMHVRTPRPDGEEPIMDPEDQRPLLSQSIGVKLSVGDTPKDKVPTAEKAYVLDTKGTSEMAVIEDGNDVILLNEGKYHKKESEVSKTGFLEVEAKQKGNKGFVAFTPGALPPGRPNILSAEQIKAIRTPENLKNFKGAEIVIGMENGRFVPEIISSIETFIQKVENGEIELPPFVPMEGAEHVELGMLAGGIGSRAEYTNASSSAIFHGETGGTESTKGVFRNGTGLTPMETTFVTLHLSGLLDVHSMSIGNNVKFFLNKATNKGNGQFSKYMYKAMHKDNTKSMFLFSNDAVSRMTNATKKSAELMNSGKAAIVMVAKKVKAEDAAGKFGVMELDKDGKILGFAEKPKVVEERYKDKNGYCVTNTFHFTVSKEAFEALQTLEKYLPVDEKEAQDWSKAYTPILMALTQNKDLAAIEEQIKNSTTILKEKNNVPMDQFRKDLAEAKKILGDQQIYAVPTEEPWADCGKLNDLYHTMMQIADGKNFTLENFERRNLLKCVNTETGLVASTPEQKERFETKYEIDMKTDANKNKIGAQVMMVPQAEVVNRVKVMNQNRKYIVTNEIAS